MGKYTPPDISEEVYEYLKPGDAFMLRGLVAKYNGVYSNCLRSPDAPRAPDVEPVTPAVQTDTSSEVRAIFEANLAKHEASFIGPRSVVPQSNTPDQAIRQLFQTREASPDSYAAGTRRAPTAREVIADQAQNVVLRATDDRQTLLIKIILKEGAQTIHKFTARMNEYRPGTTLKSVAADLWRLGKKDIIVIGERVRPPTYVLSHGFWDNTALKTKVGIR